MNCKPGDLAMVIWSHCGNEGKICRVVDYSDHQGYWLVEFPRPIKWRTGRTRCEGLAEDRFLRPIRDQGGEDEILRIAGKPQKETA